MMAAERARLAGATSTERRHLERWLAALERLGKGQEAPGERQHIQDRLSELAAVQPSAPAG